MTYAAKLKASRQKQAQQVIQRSPTTSDVQQSKHPISQRPNPKIVVPIKVKDLQKMPSSIGHGSMDSNRNFPNGLQDSNRSRNGGVQKPSVNAPRRRSFHRLSIRMPTAGMRVVKDNYFVQALSHTTYAFCRETTLHGMKYVVQDIEELGSTFSR